MSYRHSSGNSSSAAGGIGFPGVLAIVFITLKLTGLIDWSWVWVLSPIWITMLAVIAILGAWVAFYSIATRGEIKRKIAK